MSDLSDYHRLYDSRIYDPLLYRTIVSYRELIYNLVPDLTLTKEQLLRKEPHYRDNSSATSNRYYLQNS